MESRAILRRAGLFVAQLRFEPQGTIDEHAAEWEIDVACLEGEGFTSVGAEVRPIRAGEFVRWPAGEPHRLWTAARAMTTLMLEYVPGGD